MELGVGDGCWSPAIFYMEPQPVLPTDVGLLPALSLGLPGFYGALGDSFNLTVEQPPHLARGGGSVGVHMFLCLLIQKLLMCSQGDSQDTLALGRAGNNRSRRQRRSTYRGLECVGVDRRDEPESPWNFSEVEGPHQR